MNTELVVVWDGVIAAPHRGLLTSAAYPVKPADIQPGEETQPRPRTGWEIPLQQMMGAGIWTVSDLTAASGYRYASLLRAIKRAVRDGRVVEGGKRQPAKGPAAQTYRWIA